MYLTNKKILIISTDRWRNLYVSKHNYAIELAKRNNEIYFLNPVEPGTPFYKISPVDAHENIFSVDFNTTIRGIRFYPKFVIRFIEFIQIKILLFLLKKKFDVIWCFSDFSFKSLDLFSAKLVIFHPVDMMMSGGMMQAENSDVIFSVAENIVENYKVYNKPIYIINHGLSGTYEKYAKNNLSRIKEYNNKSTENPKAGYIGNLLRSDIDHDIFIRIVDENPDIEFHLWGPYEYKSINNEYDRKDYVEEFIEKLKTYKNIYLYGLTRPDSLVNELQEMDLFFICYDAKKEINKCSNNHKIIEYLSTGKCVVSNYISSYKDKIDIVVMPDSHSNKELLSLIKKIRNNLPEYNTADLMKKRISFALENTYSKQLDKISLILEKNGFT